MKVWVVVSHVCSDCGGDAKVTVFDHEPTEGEQDEVDYSGRCAHTIVAEAVVNDKDADPIKTTCVEGHQ